MDKPEYKLMFIDISRSRGLAISSFSMQGTNCLSICPTQSHLISCSGQNVFKLLKVQDYNFKIYEEVKKLPKNRNFITHSWYDKTKILISTDRGQLFMIGPIGNNFEVKKQYSNALGLENIHHEISNTYSYITSICVFSRGFILGSNSGQFSLWLKNQNRDENFEDQYAGELVKKWKTQEDRKYEINCITMCLKQEQIAVSFRNNAIAIINISTIMRQQSYNNDKTTIKEDILKYVYDGYTTSAITAIDVCLHRPIIAALIKQQNTVLIWNYRNPKCELIKKFNPKTDEIQGSFELLNCLALHPLGYYVAIGCCDKLRLYHILESDLRKYREIVIKGVCELKFSNGGHMLAAAYPRQKYNIHLINIYNSYTLEEIGSLSDHSNIITELVWKDNDSYLYSVSMDGCIAQWRSNKNKSENKEWQCRKWNLNNSRYNCIILQKTSHSILSCGLESNKPIIRQFRLQKEQIQKLYSLPYRPTKLKWLLSQWNVPAVLVGTEEGYLKLYNSPYDNYIEQSMNYHFNDIAVITVSSCGRYVFTGGKDGNIFIHQVTLTNKQGLISRKLPGQIQDIELNPMINIMDENLTDIVLIQKRQINNNTRRIQLLEEDLLKINKSLAVQDYDENKKFQIQMQTIVQEKQSCIQGLNLSLQALKEKKRFIQNQAEINFKNTQTKNSKMLEEIELMYEKKLNIENKKYYQLQRELHELHSNQNGQIQMIKMKKKETIEMLKKQFISCYNKTEKVYKVQQNEMVWNEKSFNEKISQLQDQHESQLNKLSQILADLEVEKNQKSAQHINCIELLRRENKIMYDAILSYMTDVQRLRQFHKESQDQLTRIQNSIGIKKVELEEKQENLRMREEKIWFYQERVNDLQKKKTVLSYRTWEMRQEIEPKQDEIQFLKEQIFTLERQFENLLEEEKKMNNIEGKVQRDKEILKERLHEQNIATNDKVKKIRNICNDINHIIQYQSKVNRNYYEEEIGKLYLKYENCMTENKRLNNTSNGINEMNRHIEHLDKEIFSINEKTGQTIKQREMEIMKTTEENLELIKQLEKYRNQRNRLIIELKNTAKIIESLRRQMNQVGNNNVSKDGKNEVVPFKTNKNNMQKSNNNNNSLGPNTMPVLSRSSSQPIYKGRIAKGINYDNGSISIFSKARIKQFEANLQQLKSKMNQKKLIARMMKNKIMEHLRKCDSQDKVLEKYFSDYDL